MEYYYETVLTLQTWEDVRAPQGPTDHTLRTSGLDYYILLVISLPTPSTTWPLSLLPDNSISHNTFKKEFMSVRPVL